MARLGMVRHSLTFIERGGPFLVYNYKEQLNHFFKVPAQEAGEELERINETYGELTPEVIVDASRPEDATLHPVFEWNDAKAAEEYRKSQARTLVRCIVISPDSIDTEPKKISVQTVEQSEFVRGFVHLNGRYIQTKVVAQDPDMLDQLIKNALRDVKSFKQRLESFTSLQPIYRLVKNIDDTIQELEEQ